MFTLETGSPDRPAIVFLHGGGLSSQMWRPALECLPDFYCLAPDLPEHGQSRDLRPFDLDDAARRVAEIITQRLPAGRKAQVVGLSLGGAVTLTLLRSAPELVERAMVSGTAAVLGKFTGWLSLSSLWMLRMYKPEDLVTLTARQFGLPTKYMPLFHDDLLRSSGVDFNRTLIKNLMRMRLPERVDCPLLVTVGEKEIQPAKQAARKLVGLYPTATGRMVSGLGHVWPVQDPQRFAETVRAWSSGADLPDGLAPLA